MNYSLPLHAFKAGLDDLPLRGIHHEGYFGYLGLARNQLKKAAHGGNAIDHAFVHADVENVGAVLDLLAGNAYGLFVLAFLDQLRKLWRTGNIGPLANHDEDAGLLRERLRS